MPNGIVQVVSCIAYPEIPYFYFDFFFSPSLFMLSSYVVLIVFTLGRINADFTDSLWYTLRDKITSITSNKQREFSNTKLTNNKYRQLSVCPSVCVCVCVHRTNEINCTDSKIEIMNDSNRTFREFQVSHYLMKNLGWIYIISLFEPASSANIRLRFANLENLLVKVRLIITLVFNSSSFVEKIFQEERIKLRSKKTLIGSFLRILAILANAFYRHLEIAHQLCN